ncbi:MAG: rane protein [Devosia sp.]|uniref:sulfite exporter TauE/SafE family protein n=1 Tax=Devosia sp. TaxID=1871048 RepID=UPI00261E53B6|nr:sulfite exporter TauE/SafE family protein [Devosia sp.]MDB5542503.1 rane protein [Devosia sp.]
MDFASLSLPDMLLLGGGLVGASIVAGIVAGLLGVGGGIVIVPVLYWLFTFTHFPEDLAMHMAVATSLATIITTSISSMRAHHKRGAVDFQLLRRWAPALAVGALAGGLAARFFEPAVLTGIFGTVGILVAVNLTIPKPLVIAEHLPPNPVQVVIATVIGFVSSLMGIGGGTLGVPTMAAFNYPIHRAVGTASAFGLVISIPAVIGFIVSGWDIPGRPPLSLGYVSLIATAIILPFTTYFAPLGARLAHALEPKWVKRAFAIFLTLTAIKMLMSAFGS